MFFSAVGYALEQNMLEWIHDEIMPCPQTCPEGNCGCGAAMRRERIMIMGKALSTGEEVWRVVDRDTLELGLYPDPVSYRPGEEPF